MMILFILLLPFFVLTTKYPTLPLIRYGKNLFINRNKKSYNEVLEKTRFTLKNQTVSNILNQVCREHEIVLKWFR